MDSGRRAAPETARIVDQFEKCTLPALNHEDHIRVTWYYLTVAPLARVLLELPPKLQRYAASKGAPQYYHETITFAFICLVQERVSIEPDGSWESFASNNRDLFDRSLLEGYYPKEVLDSDAARKAFVFPSPAYRS